MTRIRVVWRSGSPPPATATSGRKFLRLRRCLCLAPARSRAPVFEYRLSLSLSVCLSLSLSLSLSLFLSLSRSVAARVHVADCVPASGPSPRRRRHLSAAGVRIGPRPCGLASIYAPASIPRRLRRQGPVSGLPAPGPVPGPRPEMPSPLVRPSRWLAAGSVRGRGSSPDAERRTDTRSVSL